jgi:hypothetical protein
MEIDWNPVVHILDTLSEGTHSLRELGYMTQNYEQSAFIDSLLFLADRKLIELSAGRTSFQPIPQTQWSGILRSAFETDHPDEATMVTTQIDLSEGGDQILRLFGIGHP